MKQNILLLILLLVSFGLPQTSQAQDLTEIRRQYAEVHRWLDIQKDEIQMQNQLQLTMQHNVPGIGPQRLQYEFFLSPIENQEDGEQTLHRLRFARVSYNVAGAHYYEEYLYDTHEQPIFIYAHNPLPESTAASLDLRLYFNDEKCLKKDVQKLVGKSVSRLKDHELPPEIIKQMGVCQQRAKNLRNLLYSYQTTLIPY